MTIRIDEPGTKAFYKETVNVSAQYRRLIKNPAARIKDVTGSYTACTVFCAGMLAAELVWGAFIGFDFVTVAGAAFLGLLLILSAAYLWAMRKTQRQLAEDFHPAVLTLDEQGVELAKENADAVRTSWENIAFVRVMTHGICFAAKQPMRYIIHIRKEFAAEITAYISKNHPQVPLITE